MSTPKRKPKNPLSQLVLRDFGHGQYAIEQAPGWSADLLCDSVSYEQAYIHFSGYFGLAGPGAYLHAPQLLACLEGIVAKAEAGRPLSEADLIAALRLVLKARAQPEGVAS